MAIILLVLQTALAGFVLLVTRYVIYPAFLGPLSSVPPAHPLAALTPLWILWIRFIGRENRAIQAAHAAYGPVVRLAPSEISVNFVEGGIRTVYGAGFGKHEWYLVFRNYGVNNAFSTLESKAHSLARRRITHAFSKPYLLSPESGLSHISHTVIYDRLLPLLSQAADSQESVDILEIFFSTAMDFITGYQFGLPSSSNFLQNIEERKYWLRAYGCRKPYEFWSLHGSHLHEILKRMGIRVVPTFVADANQGMEDYVLEMVKRAEKRVEGGLIGDDSSEAMVYRSIRRAMEKEDEKRATGDGPSPDEQQLEIASELLDELAAGHETAAIALTFLTYRLCINPAAQSRLRSELASAPRTSDSTSFDLKALDNLPFLNACILETLRINAPIPGPQPRISLTPCHMNLGPEGRTVVIPPGTRVSAQAYSLHRNPDVFPDPECWNPDRWLVNENADAEEEEERLKEMHRWFWAFGSGGRMCFGSNFALLEMKMLVASIWSRFKTELSDVHGKESTFDLEQDDGYTGPVGRKLDVRFVKL